MGETPSDDLAYCAEQLSRDDPDRFATAMLARPEARARLVAIYAFNLEIARLRETVSEPMLGEIRLQWWRDAVGECMAGTPRRHQVVQPLAAAVRGADLPEAVLLEAIDARAQDLDQLPPATSADLARYVDATGGAIGELAARAAAAPGASAEDVIAAGRAAGRAWAWAGLARGLHLHAVMGRHTVPADTLSGAPDLEEDIRKAVPSEAARAWTQSLIGHCRDELARLDVLRGKVPRAVLPALAPARLARVYADRIAAAGFDPFRAEEHRLNPGRRAVLLLGTKLFRRI